MNVHQDLGDAWGTLDLLLAYDTISGASPTGGYPSVDVTTSASGHTSAAGSLPLASYNDQRKSLGLGWARKFGAHLPSIDVSYAKENDYTARSFGISDAWTLAGGRGTLHGGVSFSSDIVAPVTNSLELPKKQQGYALGWTWILDERDLLDVSASLMNSPATSTTRTRSCPSGRRSPTRRCRSTAPTRASAGPSFAKYGHYYLWDGALKIDVPVLLGRLVREVAHARGRLRPELGEEWIVSPAVRLYTQTAASFWGNTFATPQTYMSSDYRLAALLEHPRGSHGDEEDDETRST